MKLSIQLSLHEWWQVIHSVLLMEQSKSELKCLKAIGFGQVWINFVKFINN